ncbi:MAG: SH3 domain-containing protein [Alphaproteobacteria bacterium]|nr:SH3 domain-containing protein [Alphaproteobacteria bacterium]MBQ6887680.1 SH3 domain-containing protein [Lachnospiraceae bacterium]
MSGKFMKIKRIVIPTLTMVIIASQLMGCQAATQDELLTMLNNGEAIEIEVAAPINEEQGETKQLEWIQLDKLDNYKDFRKEFEDTLKITPYGESSKMGVVYVNLEGKQEGNNTLYNAFMNRKFISTYWDNETTQEKVQDSVLSLYTDVDEDSKASKYAALNAYWNLLPDAEPNYFNGDSTLTRGEAMALVMRAETSVTEDGKPESFVDFTNAVATSSSAKDDYTDFAGYLMEDSYLTVDSESLDSLTYKGTITRGEYVYMLMNHYFSDTLKNTDTSKVKFTDTKNAGNIAATQKYIEKATEKAHWQAYELTYAIQNVENGCPERMYKALACAANLEILDEETRWDEGLTKTEAIELLVNTYEAYTRVNGYAVDAMQGEGTLTKPVSYNEGGEVVAEKSEMDVDMGIEDADDGSEAVETMAEVEETTDFEVKDMEPTTMYALQSVNLRQGPDAKDFKKVGSLKYAQSITVTGEVKEYKGEDTNWLRAETEDGKEVYVAAKYLSIHKPSVDNGNAGGSTGGNNNNGENTSGNSGGNSGGSGKTGNSAIDNFFNSGSGAGGGVNGQATVGDGGGVTGGVTLY